MAQSPARPREITEAGIKVKSSLKRRPTKANHRECTIRFKRHPSCRTSQVRSVSDAGIISRIGARAGRRACRDVMIG